MKLHALLVCAGTLIPGFAQTGAILTTTGYSAPAPFQVAPGQVITFFFRGIGPLTDGHLRTAQATTVPLPKTLAGLSLRIALAQTTVDAPLFAVRQESDCVDGTDVSAACLLTSLRLQIPFEVNGDVTASTPSGPGTFTLAPLAQMMLLVDGQAGRVFSLQPVPDNAHILTSCDAPWDTKYTSVCDRHAYHADGHPVTETEPAMGGETLVVYVYGLGQPSNRVPTGDVSPSGTTLTDIAGRGRVKASFDNMLNSLSSAPRFLSSGDSSTPDSPIAFGGLTPGQIGLYQLNIPVPQSLALAGPCGGSNGAIHSNASLRVTTSQGTELLAICIQPRSERQTVSVRQPSLITVG